MTNPSSPTVAVAFGGGGARGLAHIHIIETLDELGIKPVAIAGSSIGAIMGSGMAAGMKGSEIRDFTLKTIGDRREVISRLWSMRPMTMREMVTNGFRVGQYNLERILRTFLPDALPSDFSELEIPLSVTATDYYGVDELLIDSGELFPALAASAAIPAIFMPVIYNGRVMIDGGIFNPVPYDHLMGKADIVIGIDVVGQPVGDEKQIPRSIESLFGASQIMMQSITNAKMKISKPDIFLRPHVGKTAVMDFLKAADILAMSAGIRDDLKRALGTAMELKASSSVDRGSG